MPLQIRNLRWRNTNWLPLTVLVAAGLAMRLTLMSESLDEIDAANFVNALTNGYNIPAIRPHAPGYPIYVLLGSAVDMVVRNPLASLTTLSAVLGSIAVIPFYGLLKELVGARWAIWGCLLLLVNPMYWTFSETALSDVPSAAVATALAYTSVKGMKSRGHLYASAVLASIAIGIRLGDLPLLCIPAVSLAYVLIRERRDGLGAINLWLRTFGAVTGIWVVYMVFVGSDGTAAYIEALQKQWTTAVRIYDIRSVAEPRLVNAFVRIERFFAGYFFTYPWVGVDERSRFAAWLSLPWVTGLSFFAVSLRVKDAKHLLLALWVISIVYTSMTIHFLPRYALPHLPGYLACVIVGYRFLVTELRSRPRAIDILLMTGAAIVLFMFAIKLQPPVATYEFSPPEGSYLGAVLFGLAIVALVAARFIAARGPHPPAEGHQRTVHVWSKLYRGGQGGWVLAPLVLIMAIVGFNRVSIAHASDSPTQQLVRYVRDHYDPGNLAVCWDPESHSYFEVLIPGVVPVGYRSLDEIRASVTEKKTLVATDHCIRYEAVSEIVDLHLVATFRGTSPAWSKAPVIKLYSSDP